MPLQNTEWAEGFRAGVSGRGAGTEVSEGGQEGDPLGGVLAVIGPLIKVTILMGIGGLLTALGLWVVRMASGSGKGRSEVKKGSE